MASTSGQPVNAVQCWTSIEENLGVVPCTVMSMMSDGLLSSACEVDICGVLGMHALRLASETPSVLLDWNNNYGADPNKAVCFHCSNLPKHFFRSVKMDFQEIIAGTVGKENTGFAPVSGLIKPENDELRPAFRPNDTVLGTDAWLCRPRKVYRRSVEHFRWRGRRRNSRDAEASALHLRKRIRASCCRQPLERGAGRPRSHHPLSGLGYVLALQLQPGRVMAIVAGVDFGTLSVRVSIVDSERGLLDSAVAEYPLHRKREDPEYATQSHDDHMRALTIATREALKQSLRYPAIKSRRRSLLIPPARRSFQWEKIRPYGEYFAIVVRPSTQKAKP